MTTFDYILLIIMSIVFLIMVSGLVVMTIGGKTSQKYSNKLMRARVAAQALVILLLGIMFMLSR